MQQKWLIGVLLILCVSCYAFEKAIKIKSLMTLPLVEKLENPSYDINNGLYAYQGNMSYMGQQLWAEMVNETGGITVGNNTYGVWIEFINVGANTSKVTQKLTSVLNGTYGQFDFLFAPWSSGFSDVCIPIIARANRTLIFPYATSKTVYECGTDPLRLPPPCTSVGRRRTRWAWGVMPTSDVFFEQSINLIKLKGAETFYVWASNETFSLTLARGARIDSLGAGLRQVGNLDIVPVSVPQETIEWLVAKIKELNPDVVFASMRSTATCVPFIRELKKNNVNPKAVYLSQCLENKDVQKILGDDLRYFLDYSLWDRRLKGYEFTDPPGYFFYDNSTEEYPSAQLFYDTFKSRWNQVPDGISAVTGFATGYVIMNLLTISKSLEPALIQASFPFVIQPSFFGTLNFNAFGYNDKKEVPSIQMDENRNIQVISPLGSSTLDLIYPFPEWNLRSNPVTYAYRPLYNSEIAVFTLTILAIVFSFILLGLIWLYRNKTSIKTGSPLFISYVLIGTIILYCSNFVWSIVPNKALCILTWWFVLIGFLMVFLTIFLRTFRLFLFWKINLTKQFTISESKLSFILFTIVILNMIILAVGSGLTGGIGQVEIDKYRPSYNYYHCAFDTTEKIIIAIFGAEWLILIIFGTFLAVSLRKVPYYFFNETRQLVFCLYNLVFFLIVIIVLQYALSSQKLYQETLYVIRSIIIIIAPLITILTLFMPRLRVMNKDLPPFWGKVMQNDSKPSSLKDSNSSQSSPQTIESLTNEIRKHKEKIQNLKKDLQVLLNSES